MRVKTLLGKSCVSCAFSAEKTHTKHQKKKKQSLGLYKKVSIFETWHRELTSFNTNFIVFLVLSEIKPQDLITVF